MSDLMIRETILGLLKTRDFTGTSSLHASEFRKIIADLGIPWGSPLVERIQVLCKNDGEGNINFSNFENDLTMERKLYNEKMAKSKALKASEVPLSSKGASIKPWNPDTAHKNKVQNDHQSKLIRQYNQELLSVFKRLTNKELMPEDATELVKSYGIKPTRAFNWIIGQAEISFKQFLRSLANYDDSIDNEDKNVLSRQAGLSLKDVAPKLAHQENDGIFLERKRSIWRNKSDVLLVNDDDRTVLARMLGNSMSTGFATVQNHGGSRIVTHSNPRLVAQNSANLRSSSTMKDTIFFDPNATPSLLSTAQELMLLGNNARPNVDTSDFVKRDGIVHYNCEIKALREQTLAALRQLDSLSISVADFQDRMYALGLNVPDLVLLELNRVAQCGQLDYKKCVALLDNTIFKVTAAFDVVPKEVVNRIRQKFLDTLQQSKYGEVQSVSSILKLNTMFHKFDTDKSDSLTFYEFINACRGSGIENDMISEKDLRILFTHFDVNGDGELQYEEFMNCIRGTMKSLRFNAVKLAFKLLDRKGKGKVSLLQVLNSFNSSYHFDVMNSLKYPNEVTTELTDFFISRQDAKGNAPVDFSSREISLEDFKNYHANISAVMESDDDFVQSVKRMWGLDENKAPPPPELLEPSFFGNCSQKAPVGGVISKHLIPSAAVSHGDVISWNQEKSQLESANLNKERMKRDVGLHKNATSNPDILKWNANKQGTLAELAAGDLKADGLVRLATSGNAKNMSAIQSLLEWKIENKKTPPSAPSPIVEEFKDAATTPTAPPPGYIDYIPAPAAGSLLGFCQHGKYDSELAIQTQPKKRNETEHRRHFIAEKPFGVDPPTPPPSASLDTSSSNNKSSTKSLKDIMDERKDSKNSSVGMVPSQGPREGGNKPRSLADMMQSQLKL